MGKRTVKTEIAYTCDRCWAKEHGDERMPEGWDWALSISDKVDGDLGQIHAPAGGGAFYMFQIRPMGVVYGDRMNPVLLCPSCIVSFEDWLIGPFRENYVGGREVLTHREHVLDIAAKKDQKAS